ncbi:MAG: oxidoreductase [Rhodospirillales bacterium]|nr:oxidoreductase [Rhodospirillales bacterium]
MSDSEFKALLLNTDDAGKVTGSFETISNDRLPEGDVTVAVKYTTLNYKDGMILNGIGKLVRNYPHIPGIDFSGVVETSAHPDYKSGDEVILTGWRVGEVQWGGFSTRARVNGDWLVPLPKGLSLEQAMSIGTAGLTAMLAIMTLEEHKLSTDADKEVLVTGGAGGVGSIAVSVLSNIGYKVAASTGRPEQHDYLKSLGASMIVERDELVEPPKGPLGKERWAGAIDNVGGPTLHHVLATLGYWGACASVGNAGSFKLDTTVLPFLLRGINLCGIDSATCPTSRRMIAWDRLSKQLPLDKLESVTNRAGFAELPELAGKILKGQVRGRMVIDVNG